MLLQKKCECIQNALKNSCHWDNPYYIPDNMCNLKISNKITEIPVDQLLLAKISEEFDIVYTDYKNTIKQYADYLNIVESADVANNLYHKNLRQQLWQVLTKDLFKFVNFALSSENRKLYGYCHIPGTEGLKSTMLLLKNYRNAFPALPEEDIANNPLIDFWFKCKYIANCQEISKELYCIPQLSQIDFG